MKSDFEYPGFFLLRSATLPIDSLQSGEAATHLPATGDFDKDALARWIRDPLVQAAVYLASPSLSGRLNAWLADPVPEEFEELRPALFRYFVRMSTRATPFGLFAATSVGYGIGRCLEIGARSQLRRHSWIDLDYVYPLVEQETGTAAAHGELPLIANGTLYRVTNGWRYIVKKASAGQHSAQELVQIAGTDLLDSVLVAAREPQRAQDFTALVQSLDESISPDDSREFIQTLIDERLLQPALVPTLTGEDPVQHVLAACAGRNSLTRLHTGLRMAADALQRIDSTDTGQLPGAYAQLAPSLLGLLEKASESRLFHVDLRRGAPGLALPPGLPQRIGAAVEALRRITPRRSSAPLNRFCQQFEERYGDRVVRLVEALDEDNGIGFAIDPGSRRGEGLLAEFPFTPLEQDSPPVGNSESVRHLADLLEDAWTKGRGRITLQPRDIDKLSVPHPAALPYLLTVMGCLAPIDNGNTVNTPEIGFVLDSAIAGAGLLGRFCRADPALEEHVRALLRAEQALHPDIILAEIVHLPENRLGNVICRPALRDKEIVFQGESGMGRADQIPLHDLTVAIEADRVVLRSIRLDREIHPRLSCAHRVSPRDVSAYRFLAAITSQDWASGLRFSWGAHAGARFLPRVDYRDIVFAPASWRIDKEEYLPWRNLPQMERLAHLTRLRQSRGIPRWIRVGTDDNLLTLDLEQGNCVDALLGEFDAGQEIRLHELLPAPESFLVKSPEGRHAHELLLPLIQRTEIEPRRVRPSVAVLAPRTRRFAPGSAWMYAKFYGGLHATESLLRTDLAPRIAALRAAGIVESWHFVRYRDPAEHLRLRLHGAPDALRLTVQPALEQSYARACGNDALWRLQFDTYERETERYGGPEGVEIAEQIFDADSSAVLALLQAAPAGIATAWRWQVAIRAVDMYFDALDLNIAQRAQRSVETVTALRAEFGTGAAFEKRLSERYRADRPLIESLVSPAALRPPELDWAGAALAALHAQLTPLACAYRELARAGRLGRSMASIASALTHMHINRMMLSNPREHEFIIHAFLQRTYRSRMARAVQAPSASPAQQCQSTI